MAEIRVPTLGESVTEATIGRWFKKAGEPVAVDEPLVELETDKVTIEVPAPAAGVLSDIAAKDGETVAVGALLGQIKEGATAAPSKSVPAPAGQPDKKTATTAPIGVADEEPKRRTQDKPEAVTPKPSGDADAAFGPQNGGGNRRRSLRRRRQRQARPGDQGRHDGGDRARRISANAGRRRRCGADARAFAGR